MCDDGVDRQAFPDDLDDDTMSIDVPGIAPGTPHDHDDGIDFFHDGHDEDEMHDSLILAGVYADDAKIFAASIVASAKPTTYHCL